MVKRRDDAERQIESGARVPNLRAGDERHVIGKAGGRSRAAGALRDVLVDLAILIGSRAEAFDRGDDHLRIDRMNLVPGEAHAIEHAGPEILDKHVAGFDEARQHLLALRMLGIKRDRALVVVQHGEIEAVHIGNVAQLSARNIADTRTLHLDHVRTKPRKQLRAGRSRLYMREVEDFHALECLTHLCSSRDYFVIPRFTASASCESRFAD